jgi:hypothetical protein
MGSKRTKADSSEKDKETSTSKKKDWKAKFAELEAKMAAMSATTTSGSAKPQVTPSFHAGNSASTKPEKANKSARLSVRTRINRAGSDTLRSSSTCHLGL